MAKLVSKTLRFPGSDSPDVVGYKFYIADTADTLDYSSESVDLGNVTEVDLSTLSVVTGKQGVYDIGVTAYDSVGNESDMSVANAVPLDFIAPNAPGALEIVQA